MGNTPLDILEGAFGYHVSVCSVYAQFNCGGFVQCAPPYKMVVGLYVYSVCEPLSRWCQDCMGTMYVPLHLDSARPACAH